MLRNMEVSHAYPVLSLRKPAGAYQVFLPRSHCVPRVDDGRVVSGITYAIRHGLKRKDAPEE